MQFGLSISHHPRLDPSRFGGKLLEVCGGPFGVGWLLCWEGAFWGKTCVSGKGGLLGGMANIDDIEDLLEVG